MNQSAPDDAIGSRAAKLAAAAARHGKPFKCAGSGCLREVMLKPSPSLPARYMTLEPKA